MTTLFITGSGSNVFSNGQMKICWAKNHICYSGIPATSLYTLWKRLATIRTLRRPEVLRTIIMACIQPARHFTLVLRVYIKSHLFDDPDCSWLFGRLVGKWNFQQINKTNTQTKAIYTRVSAVHIEILYTFAYFVMHVDLLKTCWVRFFPSGRLSPSARTDRNIYSARVRYQRRQIGQHDIFR